MAKLEQEKIASRQEVVIPITLSGLAKGYKKIFHDAPLNAFKWVARKFDSLSTKMMTGHAAGLTMPVGIMIRNGARVAHSAVKDYSGLTGFLGAGGALYFSTLALMPVLAAPLGLAAGGFWAYSAAAAVGSLTVVPGYTGGVIAGSAVVSSIATVASAIPAIVNLPVALRRSWDKFKGINYDEQSLKDELKENSLESEYERQRFKEAKSSVSSLPKPQQKIIYENLHKKFKFAAEPASEAPAQDQDLNADGNAQPEQKPKNP